MFIIVDKKGNQIGRKRFENEFEASEALSKLAWAIRQIASVAVIGDDNA